MIEERAESPLMSVWGVADPDARKGFAVCVRQGKLCLDQVTRGGKNVRAFAGGTLDFAFSGYVIA